MQAELARRPLLVMVFGLAIFGSELIAQTNSPQPYFGIRVIDEDTQRGVPLVELRTVNERQYFTDSSGWVAFLEPGLMDQEIFFWVNSPGYEFPKDGFGFRGIRLTTTPGTTATLKLKRTNLAERLYRVTGQGIHRDSELLGQTVPKGIASLQTSVVGQDSVQVVPYQGKLFWLWGDTNLANYPLGNFHTTSATTPLPGPETFDPAIGIPLTYFVDEQNPARPRKMVPTSEPGVVWLFGLLTIPDNDGKTALLAHFSRRKSLTEEVEQGLVRFHDETGVFAKISNHPLSEKWRFPRGNALLHRDAGTAYYYFTDSFAQTRVKAEWASLRDPQHYEAFRFDLATGDYRWQREHPPTTQVEERALLREKRMKPEQARYPLLATDPQRDVEIHRSSIQWNAFRKCWVLLGTETNHTGQPSHLGEVWYAEAQQPTGPWRKGIKVATHPRYTFYNVRHHPFLDTENGRFIHFEGTYTNTFSGNPTATPGYDYNQLMYRLDLANPRLEAVRE